MERAVPHDWLSGVFEKHPELFASYALFQRRKEEGQLQLWERCMLGEILPQKVYAPIFIQDGARCELCGDVGYREFWQDGYLYAEECECFNRIKSETAMKKANVNQKQTFDTWVADWDYQVVMGGKAQEFADGGYLSGQWFYAGGQVGCGKTHICTAIINKLVQNSIGCRYMMWRDEAVQLKAIVNNHQEYHARLMNICKAPVLYIDDLFKTQSGAKPTQADVNLAFQIINFRYQDKKYCTIISCEYTTDELMKIDEAVGSRIFERSKAYRVEIEKDPEKNYRLRME